MKKSGKVTRRGFMATALSGIVGAGVIGMTPPGAGAAENKEKTEGKTGIVIHRKLGKTDITLPIVGMGVMNADDPAIVRASYEIGVRHFDTAAYYQSGRNEEMVGGVIKELKARKDVTIATKIFAPNMRKDVTPEKAREIILAQIDESLSRLQMDHVDILYVHNIAKVDEVGDMAILGAMKEIKKAGKTRYIGVSTHGNMHAVIDEVSRTGNYDVVLTAVNFTMGDYTELFAAIDNAAKKGVGIIAMKTQAGSARRSRIEISKDFSGSTVATAALKWVLRNNNIHSAVPGYTTFEHMKEDFSVVGGLEYNESERKFLEECNVKVGMGFCRQCGLCINTCPSKVDIPTLMRTHMYAARYSNFSHARATLGEIGKGAGLDACSSCVSCRATCSHSIDITGKIDELKLIYC